MAAMTPKLPWRWQRLCTATRPLSIVVSGGAAVS